MGIFADLRRSLSLDPYPDVKKVQDLLDKSGPTRIFFQISSTDLLAGTSQWIPSPFNGNITRLTVIVQVNVTTGDDITVEVDGVAVTGLVVAVGSDSAGTIVTDVPTGDGTEEVLATSRIAIIPGASFASAGEVNGWLEIEPN